MGPDFSRPLQSFLGTVPTRYTGRRISGRIEGKKSYEAKLFSPFRGTVVDKGGIQRKSVEILFQKPDKIFSSTNEFRHTGNKR